MIKVYCSCCQKISRVSDETVRIFTAQNPSEIKNNEKIQIRFVCPHCKEDSFAFGLFQINDGINCDQKKLKRTDIITKLRTLFQNPFRKNSRL